MSSQAPATPVGVGGRFRVRLDFAYDGTDFHGWAAQPGLRTVEGCLVEALTTVLRAPDPIVVTVAGRTDAGVHSSGQVVHFDAEESAWHKLPGRSPRPPEVALCHRLVGLLPEDIVVRSACRAPAGFDARFSAIARQYEYRVSDSLATRSPVRRHDVLWLPEGELDLDAMHRAAQSLLGEHDWLPFCRPRAGATTVRTLQRFEWRRDAGDAVALVRADAFCHHMVRSLVGACLWVGSGRRPETWPADVLAAGVRDSAVQVSPARGLTLHKIFYPPDDQLAAQAQMSRRLRVLPGQDEPRVH